MLTQFNNELYSSEITMNLECNVLVLGVNNLISLRCAEVRVSGSTFLCPPSDHRPCLRFGRFDYCAFRGLLQYSWSAQFRWPSTYRIFLLSTTTLERLRAT